MMVVENSTSASPRRNVHHHVLQLALGHLAVADADAQPRAPAAQRLGRLVDRLDPVVQVERLARRGAILAAQRLARPAPRRTPRRACVIGRRPRGGVVITEMSRRPDSDMCSVRGIGVADIANTSTSSRSWRSSSFWATPKRCSSSTTTRPRLAGTTSRDSTRWVPIRTSTLPVAEARRARAFTSAAARKPRDHLDRDGRSRKRSRKVWHVLLGEDRRRHQHQHLAADVDHLAARPGSRPRSCRSRRRRRPAGPSAGRRPGRP